MRWIVKAGPDEYFEWSTISDSPISPILNKQNLTKEILQDRLHDFILKLLEEIEDDFNKADKFGCSNGETAEDAINCNQLGKNYKSLRLKALVAIMRASGNLNQ